MTRFNEDTRVKIPALLHLTRLGYRYRSLKDAELDERCNFFPGLFRESLARINPGASPADIDRAFEDLHRALQNEDLGREFHQRLIATSGLRLLDFEDFSNNSLHVVTELPFKHDEDEFRPDIVLIINGMPLVFVEVKKPNNPGAMLAERQRTERRLANPAFRHFFNLVQLMLFSDNMPYDDGQAEPVQGAFYATPSRGRIHFNHFREEQADELARYVSRLDPEVENLILRDTNLASIKGSPEFARNKAPDTPTHALLTSLCSPGRLAFLLRYGFAYLQSPAGIDKHVMRYPQLFASQAIVRHLEGGKRKGIIWHTQGSGKTALAWFSARILTDWFHRRGQVPRFYFVVDRLDLLEQASREFTLRGLYVHRIQTRDEFARDTRLGGATRNPRGLPEITVVNIQKFKDDPRAATAADYNLDVQRVYFLDEVHRSYSPTGSFLANLEQSDRGAIHIGLTGTPLIGEQLKSRDLFGDYIHTYYYNASIADGYTLRLIREAIETRYRLRLQEALAAIEVQQGSLDKTALYAHPRFASAMLDYILDDFRKARVVHGDESMGGMVICHSSEQARELHRQFQERMARRAALPSVASNDPDFALRHAADGTDAYLPALSAALILHDEGGKQFRKDEVDAFKDGKIDLLFVYNMLLTGFDAPRLKKLYLARVVRKHNLLQALTRVNRRHGDFRYGYVVDFAGIQEEFEKTNRDYYAELTEELGDELDHYSDLFMSPEEIRAEIDAIRERLFGFSLTDRELFAQQLGQIEDIDTVRELVRALTRAGELYNLIRLAGHDELKSLLDHHVLNRLRIEAGNALASLNLKQRMESATETTGLLNEALEDVLFKFVKIGQVELKLADELREALRRTRELLAATLDPQDPAWISLREELERLFKAGRLNAVGQDEMQANIDALRAIRTRARQVDQANRRVMAAYDGDAKLMRVHKRLVERGFLASHQVGLQTALRGIKHAVDERLFDNLDLLQNPAFFERSIPPIVIAAFDGITPNPPAAEMRRRIQQLLVAEYLGEAQGQLPFS